MADKAAGRLTLDDLADVQVAAWDARDVWYNVGIQLHVSVPTLKSIRGENLGNNGACLTEVLTEWLKGIDPVPTWTGLAEALKQPTVSQPRLAAEIEGRYLNLARLDDSTVNTSGVNADVEGPSTCTVPKLTEKPTLNGLRELNVLTTVAHKWEDVALALHFDFNVVRQIRQNSHYQTDQACKEMFSQWLDGALGTREPRTWDTLLQVLENIGNSELAKDLRRKHRS